LENIFADELHAASSKVVVACTVQVLAKITFDHLETSVAKISSHGLVYELDCSLFALCHLGESFG
jgi:hypothetical protein